MTKRLYRFSQIVLSFVTLGVVASSFYFQYVEDMEPCPLCLMQRLCACLLLFLCLVGIGLKSMRWARVVSMIQISASSLGMYFSGRQLWLQSLPEEQIPACMPGLEVMMEYFPWQDILHALFLGAGNCAEVDWQWLGLSMAAWSGLHFLGMFLASVILFLLLSKSLKALDH